MNKTIFLIVTLLAAYQSAFSGELSVQKLREFSRVNIADVGAKIVLTKNKSGDLDLGIATSKKVYLWEDLYTWSFRFDSKLDTVGVIYEENNSHEYFYRKDIKEGSTSSSPRIHYGTVRSKRPATL